ncbi:MAG: phosphoribosyltransferase [Chloroflexi bacterium]|nr:phosphoribosyltransferase [Chloroflexota bacterium]MCH7953017.1 phosphoribosyltransferase [Chloroflexota bacterium]MCI0783255.1 phosphoribosyltransferase [Chloroflexota bacterium]MCI0813872.1 phosphoribosyltransferase [Chloroflexota bacterium]MCI0819144.1 phosphoribosyltransferase [Chloroflexota bacterium]
MTAEDVGNQWLAQALHEVDAVQFGDFTMGRTTINSPVYVNLRKLVSNPRALARAARVMQEKVQTLQSKLHPQVEPFQRVCGIPFGGLHLATAFSLRTTTPMIYVHPAKERNGSRVFVEGVYEKGEHVLLIDDLVTTGGGIVETAEFLRTNAGLLVRDVLVLVDREEGARERLKGRGYNLNSILGLEAMLNYLMASEKIDEKWYRKSIDYLQQRRSERGVE